METEASSLSPHIEGITTANQSMNIALEALTPSPTEPNLELFTAPQPALPSLDLMSSGTRNKYLSIGVPLYHAALTGDWNKANGIFEVHPDAVRAIISKGEETALHLAAAAKRTDFVVKLVEKMTNEDLALQNKIGNTALCFAAASGKVELAEVLLARNRKLIMIRGSQGMLPLQMAALLGHKDMVWYLYRASDDEELTPDDLIGLVVNMINTDLYDVALEMVKKHPELAFARDRNKETALHALARKPLKPSTLANQSQQGVWRRCTNFFSGISIVDSKSTMHFEAVQLVNVLWKKIISLDNSSISNLIGSPWRLLFLASELGNVDFIVTLIRSYPDLIWKVDENRRSIFHIAVLHRHESIFKLIYEIGSIKDLIATYKDGEDNNMLHLAGILAPSSRLNIVSGAALQMQRELLWFKEVEKVVQPLFAEEKNEHGETPRALFTKTHKKLMEDGEKWMKETATSCMLVAALIATVVFTAAFTIPGGNTNDTGIPVYRKTIAFMFFAISDAISLLSSSTSILTFLSILTARYAEEDFLKSLPTKLIIGLGMLFLSMATMMVAFCATFVIVFYHGLEWIAIPISLIAFLPVTTFGFLQYRLVYDVIYSTYRSGSLFRSTKHIMLEGKSSMLIYF